MIVYLGVMTEPIRLKEKYQLAKCCQPARSGPITGYFSFDDIIKVHASSCPNLEKAPPDRLVRLDWSEVLAPDEFRPDERYDQLGPNDFMILEHHDRMGVDYSLKVAADLNLPKQELFERHKRLREMKLLERVEPVMIRYRKGIVPNKWIKHRNHTYYELTQTGKKLLEYHRKNR